MYPFIPTLRRAFLCLGAAVALALSPAAPANAADRDVARTLAAIAGIVALGVVINEAKERRDRRKAAPVAPPATGWGPVGTVKRPVPDRLLPQRCLRTVRAQRGQLGVLGGRCLARHYPGAPGLPARCETFIQTHKGWRQVYDAGCLRHAGYAIGPR